MLKIHSTAGCEIKLVFEKSRCRAKKKGLENWKIVNYGNKKTGEDELYGSCSEKLSAGVDKVNLSNFIIIIILIVVDIVVVFVVVVIIMAQFHFGYFLFPTTARRPLCLPISCLNQKLVPSVGLSMRTS